MKTSPLIDQFVAHFGEMGSRWGLNRTFGQIFALVYASPQPLNADQIAGALAFSRSNVSQGLKELQSWRLVRLRHHAGDRREYFEAPADAWEMFLTLAEERRRREIEPTLEMLRQALAAPVADEQDRQVLARLRDLHDCMILTTSWFDEVRHLERTTLTQLMALGARVQKLLGTGPKKTGTPRSATPGLPATEASPAGAGLGFADEADTAPTERRAALEAAAATQSPSAGTSTRPHPTLTTE